MSTFTDIEGLTLPEFVLPQVFNAWTTPPALRILSVLGGRNGRRVARVLASGLPLLERLPDEMRRSLTASASIRFSLDDRNNVVTFDPTLPCNRPLLLCSVYEPQVFGLLRLLSPLVRVFFDLGSGLGLHALHLACMRGFGGVVHAFEHDPVIAEASLGLVQQLAADRSISVHSAPMEKVDLGRLPMPDLIRLDLTRDVTQLPPRVPGLVEAARPIIIIRMPDDGTRVAEIHSWLERHHFDVFDPILEVARGNVWPKRARLTLSSDERATYSDRVLLAIPQHKTAGVLDRIFQIAGEPALESA